jgi:hypothetical protein
MMKFKKEEWLFISGFIISLVMAFWWFGDMLSPPETLQTYELTPNERARALAEVYCPRTPIRSEVVNLPLALRCDHQKSEKAIP